MLDLEYIVDRSVLGILVSMFMICLADDIYMSFIFFLASNNFKFRWEVIPSFKYLEKN